MKNKIKEIAAYCAARISDWAEKRQLALAQIGSKVPVDYGFQREVEDCVQEWCGAERICRGFLRGDRYRGNNNGGVVMEWTRIVKDCTRDNRFILSITGTPIRFYGTKKECENLQPEFEENIKRQALAELKRYGVELCDVKGGRMWHDSWKDLYSWDVQELLDFIPTDRAELINKTFTYQG